MSTPLTEDYVLYADQRKMSRSLAKRMLLIGIPLILFMFAFCGLLTHGLDVLDWRTASHSGHAHVFRRSASPAAAFLGWMPWVITAEVLLGWLIGGRAQRKQTAPLVILNPQGISIDTTAQHLGLLTWDEIGEVRTYSLGYRYVGIVPRDTPALCRRLGTRRSWVLRLNAACIPLYQLFGKFVAPINIPQIYLPVTAEELTAMIQRCQAAYAQPMTPGALPSAPGNVWPPPPLREVRPHEH